MRPSELAAIRPHLERAVGDIDADFTKRRQLLEIAKELEEEFSRRAALPEGAPSKAKLAARPQKLHGQPVRSCPLIEYTYPWQYSAAEAARDLRDCGWIKEAEVIAEVLSRLPTGPVDGKQPEILDRQLDAIRTGAEWIRAILTTCLKEQPPAAPAPESQPPADAVRAGTKAPPRRPPTIAFKAWRLRELFKITNQEEIARKMTENGVLATQGQVSKWLKAVDAFLEAGGVMPSLKTLDEQPTAMDPRVLDMGARQDGRTPRQRDKMVDPADDWG